MAWHNTGYGLRSHNYCGWAIRAMENGTANYSGYQVEVENLPFADVFGSMHADTKKAVITLRWKGLFVTRIDFATGDITNARPPESSSIPFYFFREFCAKFLDDTLYDNVMSAYNASNYSRYRDDNYPQHVDWSTIHRRYLDPEKNPFIRRNGPLIISNFLRYDDKVDAQHRAMWYAFREHQGWRYFTFDWDSQGNFVKQFIDADAGKRWQRSQKRRAEAERKLVAAAAAKYAAQRARGVG